MDGDFAPLKELIALKKEFSNLKIYLDEAHSIGVCGDLGLGLAKSLGVENEVDFIMLAFGKAIASVGACVRACVRKGIFHQFCALTHLLDCLATDKYCL